jgi:hypothetical protein
MACYYKASLGGFLNVDSEFVQMVSDLKTTKTFNLEDCLCGIRCEALLEVGYFDLRKSRESISEFLVESDSVIQELLSILTEGSHASFNISQE